MLSVRWPRLLLLVALALIGATARGEGLLGALPGDIREHVSAFDNGRELVMEPAWIYEDDSFFSGAAFKLGLQWRSTMASGEVVVIAQINGIQSIAAGPSLHFNLDGEFFHFESSDVLTDVQADVTGNPLVGTVQTSSKRYTIPRSFIDRLIAAKVARVRLDLSRTYVEGEYSADKPMAARRAFPEFMARLPAPTAPQSEASASSQSAVPKKR